jgi:ribosomal protein S12 methylthiotransferase
LSKAFSNNPNNSTLLKKQTINIVTLGCSKNTVDSEHLAGKLDPSVFTVEHDGKGTSDVVIINTCGFIGDAKEESVDTILSYAKARKKNKINKLIVMGCLSQRYKKDLENEIHEVDAFYGVNDLDKIAAFLGSDLNFLGDAYHYKRLLSTYPHYAYLKISEGCDRNCSFCAIPLIRGKHISQTPEKITQEAAYLASNGVKELILIAQDLTYFGIDLNGKRQITRLVQALTEIQGIEWVRLQYAYPHGFPDDLTALIRDNPKVCKYIDLPLQHISSRILKSMKRNVDKEQTYKLVEQIRREVPGIAFRTTFIVGYPGETESEFLELVDFGKSQRFERLGVFTYSPEEGTSAFQLEDDVPQEVKDHRLALLMEVQQDISLEINNRRIGTVERVIIDREENEFFIGRTQYDSPEVDNEVLVPKLNGKLEVGKFYPMLIESCDFFDLYAKPV